MYARLAFLLLCLVVVDAPICAYHMPNMDRIARAYTDIAGAMKDIRVVARAYRPNTPLRMVVAPLVTFLESTRIVLVELIEVSELFGDVIVSLEEVSDALCALLISRGSRKPNTELVSLFKTLRARLVAECPCGAFVLNPLKSLFASGILTFFFDSLIGDIDNIIALLETEFRVEGDEVFSDMSPKVQPV